MSNLRKICPAGTEFLGADGRADRQSERNDEANSFSSKFLERS